MTIFRRQILGRETHTEKPPGRQTHTQRDIHHIATRALRKSIVNLDKGSGGGGARGARQRPHTGIRDQLARMDWGRRRGVEGRRGEGLMRCRRRGGRTPENRYRSSPCALRVSLSRVYFIHPAAACARTRAAAIGGEGRGDVETLYTGDCE